MTSAERYARVKKLFLELCECPPGERARRLDEACGGDDDLRREVEALLALDERTTTHASRSAPATSGSIGPFRLLQKIGEGGMGEVWEAEQQKPVRRRVALKLVKWGMDTREVLARFESERQALVLMNHSTIARAFEAGATDEGRPYFAMEFVRGLPITSYCDAQRLDTRHRLELFRQVCEGVQHAHQKGVIHRDIKPSNILVTIEDGRPVPKIIDFGVAKATSQRLTEHTLFTELGQWIGTPEYMSPEQAELTSLDVDTRTDVYSLGVVLYELLAGAQPFDSDELRKGGFDEMRRRIREAEPPRPSTRVSSLGNRSQVAAEHRRTDSQALARTLRGDLDWIVMRALEKDRTRRYASPSDLAADLGRYLRNEPVEASPPRALYRLSKFARRHRAGVAAGTVILLALVAGVIGTTVGLVRAQREAESARQVARLMASVISDVDPAGPLGAISSPAAMLDRGATRIEAELDDQPLVQARLLHVLGEAYRNLGRYEEARRALVRSGRLWEEHAGPGDRVVGDSRVALGWLDYLTGHYDAALGQFEEAVTIYERTAGADDPVVANTLSLLGMVRWRSGNHQGAIDAFEESLALYRRLGLEDHPLAATPIYSHAVVLLDYSDPEGARPLLERALALREADLGPDHTSTGWIVMDLGRSHLHARRHEEARRLLERALEIQERTLGRDHPSVALPLSNLAIVEQREGNLELAGDHLERAIEILERAQGPDHPDLLWALIPYARVLRLQQEREAGLRVLERAMKIAEDAFGTDHLETARVVEAFGYHHYGQRKYDEALAYFEQGGAIRQKVFGSGHRALGWNAYNRACIHALLDDREAAFEALREAMATGWANARLLVDPDLASLRGDPEYERLEAVVKGRL